MSKGRWVVQTSYKDYLQDEVVVKIKARSHKGRWDGGGVCIADLERDSSFSFPTRIQAVAFRREVVKIKGVKKAYKEWFDNGE